jgi:hypothetical protein
VCSSDLEIGDYKKNLSINLLVIESRKKILGEKHPDYLLSLNNLANAYALLEDYNRALETIQEAVGLRKEILGESHDDYLTSLGNLATYYSKFGDFNSALKMNKEISDLRKRILGNRHPNYILSLGNLAINYLNLNDFQTALYYQIKVVNRSKEILGEKHPDYAKRLLDLALIEYYLDKNIINKFGGNLQETNYFVNAKINICHLNKENKENKNELRSALFDGISSGKKINFINYFYNIHLKCGTYKSIIFNNNVRCLIHHNTYSDIIKNNIKIYFQNNKILPHLNLLYQ